MPTSLLESIESHTRDLNLVPNRSHGLIAVSGGRDSMVLLHILRAIRERLGIAITAATFDHGLRGAQGQHDAEFVAQTCQSWGIPCITGSDTLDPALPGVEARARHARYAFLAQAARSCGADWIATAHHADDQAETVLLALTRGAGGHGLAGMRPQSPLPGAPDLSLVRPLLDVRAESLAAYAQAEGVPWRDDPTNADPTYARNRIRLSVLPVLSEINPQTVEAITRAARLLGEQDDYLAQQVTPLLAQVTRQIAGRVSVARQTLRDAQPVLAARLTLAMCAELAPQAEIGAEHIQRVVQRARSSQGGTLHLPDGLRAEFQRAPLDRLLIVRESEALSTAPDHPWMPTDSVHNLIPGAEILLASGWSLIVEADAPNPDVTLLPIPEYPVIVRTRRPSDRLRLPDGHHQKLKDWFINHKIPQSQRDSLPVVVQNGLVCAVWDGQHWHNVGQTAILHLGLVWKMHAVALS